jgi:hypothetical protein
MVRCSRGINVAGVRAVPAAEWLRAEVMQVRFVELLATVFDFTRLIKRQAGQASRAEVVLVTVPACVNSTGQPERS